MTNKEALEIILRQVEHDLAVDHIGKVEKLREAFEIVKVEVQVATIEGKSFPIGNDADFGTNME
jgi:hypothetical protein